MRLGYKIAAAFGAAGVAASAFFVGTAAASIPDSNNEIHACYDAKGNTRIIDSASESCLTGETSINWAQSFSPKTYALSDTDTNGGYRTLTVSCNSGDILLSAYASGTTSAGKAPDPTFQVDANNRPTGASWYIGYNVSWDLICMDI